MRCFVGISGTFGFFIICTDYNWILKEKRKIILNLDNIFGKGLLFGVNLTS